MRFSQTGLKALLPKAMAEVGPAAGQLLSAIFDHLMVETEMTEIVTAANVIDAKENGKTFFLDRAAGFASTLPAPALGLEFAFFVKTPPTGGDYTIVSNGGADVIKVSVNELETDTGDDGPADDDADVISFKANISLAGDMVYLRCDGTYWYATGQARADGAVTTGTT